MIIRKCFRCGKEARTGAELTLFVKGKKSPYGRKTWCKQCGNRINREWRKKHPGFDRAYMVKWRQENREHLLQYQREWVKENPDKIREYNRRRRKLRAGGKEKNE